MAELRKHQAEQAAPGGGSRPLQPVLPASASAFDAGDFPLLLEDEPSAPPSREVGHQDLQAQLREAQRRLAAMESGQEESFNRLVYRHQQQQDVLTAKYSQAASQSNTLKTENEALRAQLDRLHRLEARREEDRLHEARLTAAVARQAGEQSQMQERARELQFKAREAKLGDQHQLDLQHRLEEERSLHEARQTKALAALADRERKRGQQLLSQQEQEFKAREAGAKEQHRLELERRQAEDAVSHAAQLNTLTMDMFEQELEKDQLKKDILQLNESHAAALQQQVDNLLGELAGLHMSLVVYHAGLGNISLTPDELPKYLQSPIAFAADKCMVTEVRYRSWLEHSSDPRCKANVSTGKLCEARLIRIDSPTKFVPGQSDRCSRHQSSDAAIDNVLRYAH